ncbi:hypothetical protein FRC12_016176 [Ceratobasidium sp. 428]|nr:hypothetical protein FRC12_016176 [Ceratobasidium sp. 428]
MTTISCFAALPELRQLELQLDLSGPTPVYNPAVSPLVTLEASSGSTIFSKFEDMDRIAHTLLNIFPNLARVVWANDPLSARVGQPVIERVGFLNGHLTTLKELRALKKLSIMS